MIDSFSISNFRTNVGRDQEFDSPVVKLGGRVLRKSLESEVNRGTRQELITSLSFDAAQNTLLNAL